VLEVTADADPLKADNCLRLSVPVVDRIPVLLVSGDLNPEPLAAETAFLELALQPFGAARNPAADLIAAKVVREEQLTAALLAEAKVVVLANVRALTDEQRTALEAFVRDGGGLLVFPGDRLNVGWYNDKLAADNRSLLPARFLGLAGSEREGDTPATLVVRHYEHPALALFNDPRNGSLAGAEVRLWYRLADPRRGAAGGPAGITVAAELDSGDPFLIARDFGDGRVIQCAVPCDADWSNLPLRPFYLPLTQEMVTWLAANVYPPRNVEPGQNLTAFLPVADADKPAAMVDPEGKRHALRVSKRGSRGVLEFRGATRPGLYVMEPPGGNPIHFVVNVPREESDLAALSTGELQTLAKELNARIVRSWKEYRALEQKRRNGQELWPFLLWTVVGLMFLELLLEQYLARRRI
jgi:hypothetical protein